MKKLILGLILALGFVLNAHSQVTSSLGGTYLSDYRGVDVGALVGSLGYRIAGEGNWSFQPEVRYGVGITDDSVRGFSPSPPAPQVDVELDNMYGVVARFQYQTDGNAYLFVQPTLTRIELDAGTNLAVRPLNDPEWAFGADIGAGFMFGERFGLEGSYGVIDKESVFTAALRGYF